MKDIALFDATSEEGRVYGRMLELELEDAGYTVFKGTADMEKSEISLALIDAECDHLANALDFCQENELLFLVYGKRPFSEMSGLGLQPEEYLVRPFSMRELMLCISSRTCTQAPKQPVSSPAAMLVLGTKPADAAFRGQPLGLTGKEHALLRVLWENVGKTVSRETLYRHVWGGDEGVGKSNVVDVCVGNLRKKLDDRFALKLICSVRGKGYRLDLREEVDVT